MNSQDQNGKTELMVACENKSTSTALKLLDSPIDLDIQDNQGYTALMYAINYQLPEVAEKIINKKANLNLQTKSGVTALMYACRTNTMCNTAILLIEQKADLELRHKFSGFKALKEAFLSRIEIVVLKLIEYGANLDMDGFSALLYACSYNMEKAALKLIEKGICKSILKSEYSEIIKYACYDKLENVLIKLIDEKVVFTENDQKIITACDCQKVLTYLNSKK